ncbi:c-type cytochrome [Amphritea sp. HPY]|uniref:c-type cytochrome n=1 Tax=Amphritea sp. HPY TaxID=3421652 RepID=UPI003D7D861A
MKKRWLISPVLALLVIALLFTFWASTPLRAAFNSSPEQTQLNAKPGNIANGAYLARASGCIACHTDKEAPGQPLAGGAPLQTPFGTFYAPNLTTDKTHGIGNWTLQQFAQALRHGISPAGEPYYPAFPYTFYTRLSDQDIADLWAAFKTVPPANQANTAHKLGFPFNIRQGVALWQSMFMEDQPFTPSKAQNQHYNRGKYLVESAAHCAACHSPRNLLGALEKEQLFTGSPSLLEGEGSVPAITAQALTEAGWTESDLSYALQSGIKADGDVFGGSMSEVVRDGTSFLQKQDLDAIAYYLFNKD